MSLLEVRALSKHFGGIRAIEEVTFSVRDRMILSIIGPNGAGKTTLFNCLTGFMKPTRGNIFFDGDDISRLSPARINRLGLARTFQNIRLFREMTVIENIMIAQHTMLKYGLFSAVLRTNVFRSSEKDIREKAFEYLELLGLEQYAHKVSGSLAYGVQRRIEIARAVATGASILLLDEPVAGMNPQESSEVMLIINNLKSMGKTVLLIEHDMKVVMEISDRIVVLDHGVKIAEGGADEIRKDPLVIEAYLGKEAH